jgi:hypothetical protein
MDEILKEYRILKIALKIPDDLPLWLLLFVFVCMVPVLLVGNIWVSVCGGTLIFVSLVACIVLLSSHSLYLEQYQKIKRFPVEKPDQLVELILSGKLTDDEISEMLTVDLGESFRKKDNRHLVPFMTKLREHRSELSEETIAELDWILETHGW